MPTQFKIIVPSYNAAPWIEKCLDSIGCQGNLNYAVCVVDDASTDRLYSERVQALCEERGWIAIRRDENGGPLASLVDGINALQCNPDDVIVVVDGDDWLAHDGVLFYLDSIYQADEVDITFGQYVEHPSGAIGHCQEPPPEVVANRSWRTAPMYFSHLRTFRTKLFAAIRDADLRAPDGHYLRASADWATMVPMLEMAGDRFRFVEEVLYVYNTANPIQLHRIAREQQRRYRLYVRGLPKYSPPDLDPQTPATT